MNDNSGQIANDEATNNNVGDGNNNAQAGINGAAATNGGVAYLDLRRQHRRRGNRRDGVAVNGANTGGTAQNNGAGQALAGASKGIVFNQNVTPAWLDGAAHCSSLRQEMA